MDVSHWGAPEWSVFGTFLAVLVGGGIALRQFAHMRHVDEQKSRPYVIVDFEFRGQTIFLQIRNIGATMARDVRIKFDQPLVSSIERPRRIADSPLFREPIPMIAPGRRISVLFDTFPERNKRRNEFPMQYGVTIEYEDADGKPYTDPLYPLDLDTYAEAVVDPAGLAQLVAELKMVRKHVTNWSRGPHGRLIVYGSSYDRYNARGIRSAHVDRFKKIAKEDGLRAAVGSVLDRKLRQYGWRE